MNFALSDDETAVVEAAAQVAASSDPWRAVVAGGWADLLVDDPDAGLGYLGLVAEGLGAAGIKVERPAEIGPALERARRLNAEGRCVLLDVKTAEESKMSIYR
jgi:hypothetical protein